MDIYLKVSPPYVRSHHAPFVNLKLPPPGLKNRNPYGMQAGADFHSYSLHFRFLWEKKITGFNMERIEGGQFSADSPSETFYKEKCTTLDSIFIVIVVSWGTEGLFRE